VVGTKDKCDPHISVVMSFCGPSSDIGFIAVSGAEVLEWISTNKDQFTFCFPPESFGPDRPFFLRCKESQGLLLVVLHSNKHKDVKKQVLIEGVRTVTRVGFGKTRIRKCVHSYGALQVI